MERSCSPRDDRSERTAAGCDAIARTFEDLCEHIDVIRATSSADSINLDLLRKDFEIIEAESMLGSSIVAHHLVVGADDLDDADLKLMLKRAYDAGRTVAIVRATPDQADAFHTLIAGGGRANCVADQGKKSRIALYGLQQTLGQKSSYCLPGLGELDDASLREWHRKVVFGVRPPKPRSSPPQDQDMARVGLNPTTTNPTLDNLAQATHCHVLIPTGTGYNYTLFNVQADLFITSVRAFQTNSFTKDEDFYQVLLDAQIQNSDSKEIDSPNDVILIGGIDGEIPGNNGSANENRIGNASILLTAPPTEVNFVSSYSNSESTTVSGTVGFQGATPEISASVSVEVGSSYTTNVLPTQILNRSDPTRASANWLFTPQVIPARGNFTPTASWIWNIPRDAYPLGGDQSGGGISIFIVPVDNMSASCNAPYPYPSWDPS
jgi:hypothetical protein